MRGQAALRATCVLCDGAFAVPENVNLKRTFSATLAFTMAVNGSDRENRLVDQAVAWLRARLPSTWEIDRRRSDLQGPNVGANAVLDVKDNKGTFTTLLVEAKRTFTPRDAEQLLAGMTRAFKAINPHVPILAVAEWISPQAQERLRDEAINYVDVTGNAWLSLDNPALFISAQGSSRNPTPAPPGKARAQGPKASRLIRWLVDVRPPYGVRELATATRLSQSYVSRLLDALDDEALIERNKRGAVESVDTAKLIRRWTGAYSVLKTNRVETYIARQGASALLDRLPPGTAVTGSFAAVRRAPIAAPALLAVYADNPPQLARTLDLLPSDHGSNVLLLQPYDPVVWQRTALSDGVTYVADSQAVVDCLTGTGRMPAEGQALLDWMLDNESAWRIESLAATRQA
jgi:hypothetical protein